MSEKVLPKSKKKRVLKALDGYPWHGAFRTKYEVDAYFSRDHIQCMLCGYWMGALGTHLLRAHKVSGDEYRNRFGLPRRGLTSGITFQKISTKVKADPVRIAKLVQMALPYSLQPKKGVVQRKAEYQRNLSREHGLAAVGRLSPYGPSDQKAFLRALIGGKLPSETWGLSGYAGKTTFLEWKSDLRFRTAFIEIVDLLPFRQQARMRMLGRRFFDEVDRMMLAGKSSVEIALVLGVSRSTVNAKLRERTRPSDVSP